MTRIEIEGPFYVLVKGKKQTVFDEKEEAVKSLAKALKGDANSRLLTVAVEGDKITAQEVSWKDIALSLLEGG